MEIIMVAPRRTRVLALVALSLTGALFARSATAAPPALFGVVVDVRDSQPLADTSVRIPDLGRATSTARDGHFAFTALPPGKILVTFQHDGFTPQHRVIDVPQASAIEIRLEPAPALSESITVSATPFGTERLDVAPSVDIIDRRELFTRSGLSVGDAVGTVAGARNVSTGDQAGKPMIRGLTNERVRVLTDGFAHNFQQFSLRHPPSVEPFDAERIELVRGPASVIYGPEALGGIVNLVSPDLFSAPRGTSIVHGDVVASHADNNDASTGHGHVDGAFGAFGWRASLTRRTAADTETPVRTLENSGYDQSSARIGFGAALGGGAQISAHWSAWENDFGFFLPPSPSFRVRLDNDVYLLKAHLPISWGQLELSAHRNENRRQAYPQGFSAPLTVDLDHRTTTFRAEARHAHGERVKGWLVLENYQQDNDTLGAVALLPNFESETWSAALYEELRLAGDDARGWTISGGLRYDTKELDVSATSGRPDLLGYSNEWSAFSGSLGVVRRFAPEGSFSLSLGRGWRAPSEYELFARGQHTGVAAFERGNLLLNEESNFNVEAGFEWKSERWSATAAVFRMDFDDHIYAALTGEFQGTLPIVEYRQTNATIDGYEATGEVNLIAGLTAFASIDHVSTENENTGRALPVTPPDRRSVGARYAFRSKGAWHAAFVEASATNTEDGTASGPDELFSRDDFAGYTLIDLAAGIHRHVGLVDLAFDLVVRNATDREYMDFLDTYKQWFEQGARSPGRNVRFTLRASF